MNKNVLVVLWSAQNSSEFDKAIKILLTHYRLLFKYAYNKCDKINITSKFLNISNLWVFSGATQQLLEILQFSNKYIFFVYIEIYNILIVYVNCLQ